MNFINSYPYTDAHEFNLDWIIKTVMGLQKSMSDFEALNKITFKGVWNIVNDYPAWAVVDNGHNGYLSIKPVPHGVEITNEEYWRLVANYSDLFADFQNRLIQVESLASDVRNEMDSFSVSPLSTYLQGKKVVVFGDSVCNIAGSWVSRLIDSGVEIDNKAVDGSALNTTYSPNGYSIINAYNFTNTDIAIIAYGTNDWSTSASNGESSNTADFRGALEASINHIRSVKPTCDIILVTPTFTFRQFNTSSLPIYNYRGMTAREYVETMIDVAADKHVKVVDMYHSLGINIDNYTNMLQDSSGIYVHPFPFVSERMCRSLVIADVKRDYPSAQNDIPSIAGFNNPITIEQLTSIPNKFRRYAIINCDSKSVDIGQFTFNTEYEYTLEGYAVNQVTININDNTWAVYGYFKIRYTPDTTFIANITITGASNAIVGGLKLWNNQGAYMGGNWGNNYNYNSYENVSITESQGYRVDRDGLHMGQLNITYTNGTIPRFTHLCKMTRFANSTGAFYIWGFCNGNMIPLYISGGDIINYFAIDANNPTIIIPAQNIMINSNGVTQ